MKNVEEFKSKLTELNNIAKEKNNRLREEGFEDESLFEKIKSNVYEIFLQMIPVSVKKGNFSEEFLKFLERIPMNWYEALEKAKTSGDFEQEQFENIKIQAKVEIESLFYKVFES